MSRDSQDRTDSEFNRSIVESLSDMLLVLNLDGTIKKVNRWVIEKLKFAESELIGKPAYEIADALKARFLAVDAVERVLAMLPEHKEESFQTKDGDRIPVLLSHSVFHDDKNEVCGVVWLARDVSELKASTAQLVQMDKLSAMGELTAGVAHELNQPLNGIKLIAQGLRRDLEKKRFSEATLGEEITSIILQVDKMSEIITHMRIFTRKSDGPITDLISLNDPITGVFKLFGKQIETHGISVTIELQPDLPKIRGDAIRIEQVLLNLIGNARNILETSKKQGAKITVKTLVSNNGKQVEAWVIDNGPGILERHKKKMFEPFFTTMPPGKGTGLGLSVSRKIVEEHGGTITFVTQEGEGTTFKVALPVATK